MERIGKSIILVGILIVISGFIIWFCGDKLRFLGRLPGDIRYETEHTKFYFPITTMILISILLSLLMWLIQKLK
jgi:uncharacterized membrane protein